MPTYTLTAITIGSFNLGESDKILTLFSAERGLVRAVAKGARKPGAKISGRSDVLNVNKLLLATGKSLDIITQAESVQTFPALRQDLVRLSYCLYYAELTQHFGQGLADESDSYLQFFTDSLRLQAEKRGEASMLCLEFELHLLQTLGYKPEIDYCVVCRTPLTEYLLAAFHYDLGGIVCDRCFNSRRQYVREGRHSDSDAMQGSGRTHVTPLVWKRLILAGQRLTPEQTSEPGQNMIRANQAARRIVQGYIEHRAGRRMKSLDLIASM
ncbi:MAG TPA: DNA repair protein RecO [Planktothrix sp.]|jgi:DNA repair protein RecO (recombination protein O)